MFTLEQVTEVHDRLGNEDTLGPYLVALRNIGVETCASYVTDGHTEYFGRDGHKVETPPYHERFVVAGSSDRAAFLENMSLVEQGKLGYVEMSRAFAECGVEKWIFDTHQMTLTYYAIGGLVLLAEAIE